MNEFPKVGIIIPYFGKWPKWISYFLLSCKYNSTIDWIFFTDCGLPKVTASNLHFHNLSLFHFNKIVSEKLEFEVNISNPYKICDLRPAFGIIFSNYLTTYDFWGYADIDLIYGQVDKFITQELLQKYDVISACKEYLCGHFSLYRNNDLVNNLFRNGQEYIKIFQDTKHHYTFDERSGIIGKTLFNNNKILWLKKIYSFNEYLLNKVKVKLLKMHKEDKLRDITVITEKASKQGIVTLLRKRMMRSDEWFLKQNLIKWEIEWVQGVLTDKANNEELLYFHFIKSKNGKKFKIQKWKLNKRFLITNNGILIPKY